MRADFTILLGCYSFSDGLSWPVLVWHVTPWLTNTFWFHFYLSLQYCSIGGSGAVALADCLRSCIKLQELK